MVLPPNWSAGKADLVGKAQREKRNYPAFSGEDFKALKATYFGFISQLDYEIGRLLDYIDSHPELARNTVVLFLSDHGDRMGEHGMLYKGGDGAMLDGSAAIPFMVRWPGQEPRHEKTPVSHIDIMPTFSYCCRNYSGCRVTRDGPEAPDGIKGYRVHVERQNCFLPMAFTFAIQVHHAPGGSKKYLGYQVPFQAMGEDRSPSIGC